ncbi:MAG: hypothetical protein F6K10_24405 [Moorea sp. SIO2B7]|nr:hypothetical protein [Moorena sp. SIO2B7]
MSALVKAKLKAIDGGSDIEFMFNPNQLNFSRSISLEQSAGARSEQGLNKTSFKHPNPYTLNINNILIDSYEADKSVIPDIEKFKKTVEFGVEKNGVKRPPLYLFTWGSQNYLKCFVKTLKYKLTQFKPDGTPVRAFVDLTLEEVDFSTPKSSNTANVSQEQRQTDNRNQRS